MAPSASSRIRSSAQCSIWRTRSALSPSTSASSRADLHTARPAAYTQLRRAFERQLIWANDFARAGDIESALDARRAADAVCDELSAD